jgi:succinate dehydrogenase / fumarate reductase membrane anchor subunit
MMESKSFTMKTPLGRARGLGSGRSGTQTFWHQRLTAVAGIPLTIAFIVIVIALLGRNHAYAKEILGSPVVAVLMLLFIVTTVYHMCLGLQEIIVDYVHDDLLKYLALMANTCFGFVVGLASAYAILKLSFGV